MRTTSTTSQEHSSLALIAEVVAGTLLVAGITAVWWFLSHRAVPVVDPQAEIDRRIDDLEHSLTHLQDAFGQVVRG